MKTRRLKIDHTPTSVSMVTAFFFSHSPSPYFEFFVFINTPLASSLFSAFRGSRKIHIQALSSSHQSGFKTALKFMDLKVGSCVVFDYSPSDRRAIV